MITVRRLGAGVLIASLVASAAASVATAPSATAELPAAHTELILDREAFDGTVPGQHSRYGSVTAGARDGGVSFTALDASAPPIEVWFAPRSGETLTTGAYEGAFRGPSPSPASPGLAVLFNGGCNFDTGRFVIDEIELGPGGVPLRFSARFEWYCGGGTIATFGALSFNATADFRDRTISADRLAFGASVGGPPSEPQSVVITNLGPSPLAIIAVQRTGPDAADFGATTSCMFVTLAPTETCTITVTFEPRSPGEKRARLTLYDDFAPVGGAGRDVLLDGWYSAPPAPDPTGEYTPLDPARILDTRTGLGRSDGPVGPGGSFDVQVTGRGGVPSTGVAAVVVNATVAAPTGSSYLTIWPAGARRPEISNLNYLPGQTVPNLVTVAVGAGGRLSVFNEAGQAHVLFDVVGFYAAGTGPVGSRFGAVAPQRLFDTRDGTGGVEPVAVGPRGTLQFTVRPHLPPGATAVAINVTVTRPTVAGYLTVSPGGVARPNASNLNFVRGQTVANLVIVRVPPDGVIEFFNEVGRTHVVADLVGWYRPDADPWSPGGRFVPQTPVRVVDTRHSSPFPDGGAVAPGASLVLPNFPGDAWSVALNVTAVAPTAAGYLTVHPMPPPPPLASHLNFVPGANVPNHVLTATNLIEGLAVTNSAGTTHVLVDLFGYFRRP